jgi:hypothetical protein
MRLDGRERGRSRAIRYADCRNGRSSFGVEHKVSKSGRAAASHVYSTSVVEGWLTVSILS